MGRLCAAAFVAGAAWVQTWATLPSAWRLAGCGVALLGLLLAIWAAGGRRRWLRALLHGLFIPLTALGLGVALAVWQAQARLAEALPLSEEMRVARVEFQITGLPQGDASGWRFEAQVLRAVSPLLAGRIPAHIEVSWYAPGRYSPYQARQADAPLPMVAPGQVWQAALLMRRVRGTLNPHGFDLEGWQFQRGVRARGTVRGEPVLLADRPWASASVALARVRHELRARLRALLAGQRYGPVLIALALGDQAGVAASDWQVFNRTGITHLVSISGLHVTLVAALLGLAVFYGWRRLTWRGLALAERIPAQTAAAWAAMLTALAYCLLAGWGVPARRTFFMLAVAALALLARLPCRASAVLASAAVVVVALDPWASVSTGFWLSFGAVAVLLMLAAAVPRSYAGAQAQPSPGRWQKTAQKISARLLLAARLQLGISLALTAPLAFFFQQVPLATPIANALAIPMVSFAVTPLALLAALCVAIPGGQTLAAWVAQLGHTLFAALMVPIHWLADAPWSLWFVAASSWPWLLLALAGTAMALAARGWPLRHAGWLLLLPLLSARAPPLAPGAWRWSALDVGQGMAVVIETAHTVLLYDAGLRHSATSDQGARVVVPFLRGQGVRRIDTLVVSHADLDHAGGVRSVLQALPVERAFSSFDLDAWLRREGRLLGEAAGPEPARPAQMQRCVVGQRWQADGVLFDILHPPPGFSGTSNNARSCVLRVQGVHHSALLLGDIGEAEEIMLVYPSAQAAAGQPDTGSPDTVQADLVLMPHHGARGSSSAALVAASRARHAVAQVGAHNRYGHPAPEVLARWQAAGARVWRSDQHGAVTAVSSAQGLHVSARRQTHGRYWHGK